MRKTAATIDNYLGVPTKTSMKRTGMTHENQKWDEMYRSLADEAASLQT